MKISVQARIVPAPSEELALTNKVYLNSQDSAALKTGVSPIGDFLQINGYVYTFE
jgi:hypothetical protein